MKNNRKNKKLVFIRLKNYVRRTYGVLGSRFRMHKPKVYRGVYKIRVDLIPVRSAEIITMDTTIRTVDEYRGV